MPGFQAATAATRKARVLLLGEPKAGKTRAALSFPAPYVIDAEGSSDVYAETHPHQRLTTKSYAEAMRVVDEIIAGQHPDCGTLVIDSLTSIYNTLILSQTRADGAVDKRGWGLIKRKFSQLTDKLFYELPCNVVAIGWIKVEYARAGETIDGERVGKDDMVAVGMKYDGDAKTVYAFDSVWRMEFDKKKGHYAVAEGARGALGDAFPRGTEVHNWSWQTIAPYYAKATGSTVRGMTAEESAEHDREELERPPARVPSDVPTWGTLFTQYQEAFGLLDAPEDQQKAGFKTWLADAVGLRGTTATAAEKRMAMEVLEREAARRQQADDARTTSTEPEDQTFPSREEPNVNHTPLSFADHIASRVKAKIAP